MEKRSLDRAAPTVDRECPGTGPKIFYDALTYAPAEKDVKHRRASAKRRQKEKG
jgi:hypothetical protein